MSTLFISDLHLESSRPKITQLFLDFLAGHAQTAEALYILGDLFEVWLGDDDHTELSETVAQALQKLSNTGTAIYFMHGNRDFLIGKAFLKRSGGQLLTDPTIIDLYGTKTLLMHGDTLCIEDIHYLKARAKYRQPFYLNFFLCLPLFIRKKIANKLRHASKQHTSQLTYDLMDATLSEVAKVMAEHQVELLIHGHTHRPSIQYFQLNDKTVSRIVLSDWDKQGNVLIYDKDGTCQLKNF